MQEGQCGLVVGVVSSMGGLPRGEVELTGSGQFIRPHIPHPYVEYALIKIGDITIFYKSLQKSRSTQIIINRSMYSHIQDPTELDSTRPSSGSFKEHHE